MSVSYSSLFLVLHALPAFTLNILRSNGKGKHIRVAADEKDEDVQVSDRELKKYPS